MEMAIELPNIDTLADVDSSFLKEMLAANLYHLGRLSEKEAREILGMTRREFEAVLPKFGFSTLGDSSENIAIELKA